MSYEAYRVLHLLGVLLVFLSMGAVTFHVAGGGTKATNPHRALLGATHGLGVLIVLIAGFGLLARLGLGGPAAPVPLWAWMKLGIWLVFGLGMTLVYRLPHAAKILWGVWALLGTTAAILCVFKPF
jgi:hypothetical protein